jgi:hypothetical protein
MRLNEQVLVDSAPVYRSKLYVVDGQVVRSQINGTVAYFKDHLRRVEKLEATQVRTCDLKGRGLV